MQMSEDLVKKETNDILRMLSSKSVSLYDAIQIAVEMKRFVLDELDAYAKNTNLTLLA